MSSLHFVILEAVFWLSVVFIMYAYFGYPALLYVISIFRSTPVKKGPFCPRVSFIITAYNEQARIREKLENTLALDYPAEKLEIIVASDSSTDETDEIVRSYAPNGVRLVRAPERRGKENAQKHAIDAASGEVLVFSDVATILKPDGIRNIVSSFNDPTVGCVSSEDRILAKNGETSGEGAYVRYEMLLRRLESGVCTLVGLSGSFFAARKEVCEDWSIELPSDFNTLLSSVKKGLRGVTDPESLGYYKSIADESKEFKRKVRTVLRGIAVLMRNRGLLNPFAYGLFSVELFSHKLCRWGVPLFMLSALFSNLALAMESSNYRWALAVHLAFYLLALSGIAVKKLSQRTIFKIPAFFTLVNFAIAVAWFRYFTGKRVIKWDPSRR